MQKKKQYHFLKLKITLLLLCVLGIVSFLPVGHAFFAKTQHWIKFLSDKSHLQVEQVLIEGHVFTKTSDISAVLQLTQGSPIYSLDLNSLHEKILTLAWVKNAQFIRLLPNKLLIKIEERTPIALWQNKRQYYPIDTEGGVIADNKTIVPDLPLVVGQDAPQHTVLLLKTLQQYPKILKKMKSAIRVGNRRWTLLLNNVTNGTEVYLPDQEIESALKRLKNWDTKYHILDKELKLIDLRNPAKVVLTEIESPKKGK